MIICLDVGNTHIYGGVFKNDTLILRFRYPSHQQCTSDQLGVFFRNVLRENHIDSKQIEHVALCSVVPSMDYSIRSAFLKYFDKDPFVLKTGVKTGLNIKCKHPQEVGPDRIANCVGAKSIFKHQNVLIVDFGTATTIDALSKEGAFMGGTILPGMNIQMKALNSFTAQLPPVRIEATDNVLGQTTLECIQAGLYHSHQFAIKGLTSALKQECFGYEKTVVIGTGGFASMFEKEKLFDIVLPDLVLQGLKIALQRNI